MKKLLLALLVVIGLQTQAQLYYSADVTYQWVDPITCCDIPGNSESPYVWRDKEGLWYEQMVNTGKRIYLWNMGL